MRARGAAALGAVTLLAAAGCSAAQSTAGTFTPQGSGSTAVDAGTAAASPGAGSFTMPPFGKNVKIEMTSWLPASLNQARAVNVAKNFQLAYLYAEYTSGQDDTWTEYVSPAMRTGTRPALQAASVTTESFKGTVKYFGMSVIADPLVKGDLDVSTCFDNAGAKNTSVSTGAVLPDTQPADSHYALIGVELRPASSGKWQVISSLPATYYPEASQCKP